MALIGCAWPSHTFSRETSDLYCRMLSDLDFDETTEALTAFIATSKWPPTIACIRQAVIERRVALPDPMAAWMLVCLRYGPSRGKGDRSIDLGPVITAALDAAGVDAHGYHTADNRHWLKQSFVDTYTIMRRDALKWEDEGSRNMDHQLRGSSNGNAGMGLRVGVHAPDTQRLSLPAHAADGGGGDQPGRI